MKTILTVLLAAVALLAPSIASAQHSATVSAQASTTSGVGAYGVYRASCGTVSGVVCTAGEGVYVRIAYATASSGVVTYVDTTVVGGKNYSYYMTAICPTAAGCGNGISGESLPSNKAAAAIPITPTTLPQPPTNLTIPGVQ